MSSRDYELCWRMRALTILAVCDPASRLLFCPSPMARIAHKQHDSLSDVALQWK